MRKRPTIVVTALLLGICSAAHSALPCPPMPAEVTSVNRDVKVAVDASVGSIAKIRAGEIAVRTESVAKSLFAQFPNVDRLFTIQMMAATYCPMLNSAALSDADRLARWEAFQERTFRLIAPPTPPIDNRLPPKRPAQSGPDPKAVELRARMASEMTECVLKFLTSVQFAERGAMKQHEYNLAYQEWEIKRASLASQFESNFDNKQLASDWRALAEAITLIYALSGTWEEPYRTQTIDKLKYYFVTSAVQWETIHDFALKKRSNEDWMKWQEAWGGLRETAIRSSSEFGRKVMATPTVAYR